MSDNHCDKGPILDQLTAGLDRVEQGQQKMVDAVIEMARTQERIINIADKTADNHGDIENLFNLVRSTETALKDHIVQAHTVPITPTPHSTRLIDDAKNWSKLKASLVGAAVLGVGKIIYDFVMLVLEQVSTGGTP